VIVENNLTTAEEVTNYVKAGGGCGSCLATIDDIIASVQKESATPVSTSANHSNERSSVKPLTPVQKIALIQKVLDEEVRPVLIADGGDVELFDVEGDRIKVVLQGACGSCSSSTATLKIAIESRLRDRVSKDLVVEAV
jgi:NifU-like protein